MKAVHVQTYKSLEGDDERDPNHPSTLCMLDSSLVIHCGTMASNTDLDAGSSTQEPGGEIGVSIL